jgi:acetyl-CoA carboxylase carboxyl transferase beta subunit
MMAPGIAAGHRRRRRCPGRMFAAEPFGLSAVLCLAFIATGCGAMPGSPRAAGDLALINRAMQQVEKSYVVPVQSDKLVDNALKGMLTRLDPHSDYMNEREYQELLATTSGEFGGVGIEISVAVMDFRFCGGAMGAAAGEKITRAIELSIERRIPCVIFSSSGGARMQEGIYSLMQMAKTSAALGRLSEARIPFISVLTHPTMGGVTASFATLGDVILAEPGALIGFAGARVIKDTTKQTLPPGFQTAEFLLKLGLVDQIVSRLELRERLHDILSALHLRKKPKSPAAGSA